jgi:hypothetical protein
MRAGLDVRTRCRKSLFLCTQSQMSCLFMTTKCRACLWLQNVVPVYDCKMSCLFMTAKCRACLWLQNVVPVYDCKMSCLFVTAKRRACLWLQNVVPVYDCKMSCLFYDCKNPGHSEFCGKTDRALSNWANYRPVTEAAANTTDEHPCPSAEFEPAIPVASWNLTQYTYWLLFKYAKAFTAVKSKVIKVKVTLEQATKAQRGSRGVALLSL